MVRDAAIEADVPVEGLLALLIAESALNPLAERYGSRTREAQILIEKEGWVRLQDLLWDVAPDVSFGMSQRIVKYHWWGTGEHTVSNVLAVRKATFNNPTRDVLEAAYRLAGCLSIARGSVIDSLMVYNWGHLPTDAERSTNQYISNRANYESALVQSARLLGEGGGL